MNKKAILVLYKAFALAFSSYGQDPVLPPTNLGLTNIRDANSPGVGLYYLHYLQSYHPQLVRGPEGQSLESAQKIGSLMSMHHFVFQSEVRLFNGDLGFSFLIPLVKLSPYEANQKLSVNPGILGGLIAGTFVQWSGRRLFNLPYSHRWEISLAIPVGSYCKRYEINPSSHLFTATTYYSFTISLAKNLSISSRHHFNYNFEDSSGAKPGMFCNTNLAIEYAIIPSLHIGPVAYYLQQINQDGYDGNRKYYKEEYSITDTRERVLGFGPGLHYVSSGGLAAELKVFFETQARNRQEGIRTTLKVAYKL
jgi:hypothetical protein